MPPSSWHRLTGIPDPPGNNYLLPCKTSAKPAAPGITTWNACKKCGVKSHQQSRQADLDMKANTAPDAASDTYLTNSSGDWNRSFAQSRQFRQGCSPLSMVFQLTWKIGRSRISMLTRALLAVWIFHDMLGGGVKPPLLTRLLGNVARNEKMRSKAGQKPLRKYFG